MIELKISDRKKALISLLLTFLWLFCLVFASMFSTALGASEAFSEIFFEVIISFIFIFIYILIFWKEEFKQDLSSIKNEKALRFIITLIIFSAGVFLADYLADLVLDIPTSENQALVEDGFKNYPILTIISAVIVAPILEELIFRLFIFKAIKNIAIATLISIFTFTIVHTGLTLDFFTYLPGIIIMVLLYVYKRNIIYSITLHFIINLTYTLIYFIDN